MSDAQVLPPPRSQFDFGKPFTYVFDDPRWVNKILLGGLFYLAGVFLIGWFFVLGYMAHVARKVIAGAALPLPEWDDLGAFFTEGARLIGVALVYIVPVVAIATTMAVPAIFLDSVDNDAARAMGGLMMGCLACLIVPVSLVILVLLPASLLFAAVEQRFGAAFEFARIWSFIRRNVGNYLLAVVVYLIARFLAPFGFVLLCIGVVFTGFWSLLIATHAFAQVYKLDRAE